MIITLENLVERDHRRDVRDWILWMCEKSIAAGKIRCRWDGQSVQGDPIQAFVNSGRWLARCKECKTPIYVSWRISVLYCPECSNGGSVSAWPVEFPENRQEIEAELMKRAVVSSLGVPLRNEIELALHSRPLVPGLGRDWLPGESVEQLRAEALTMEATHGA